MTTATAEEPWETGKPVITPLTLGRARIVLPTSEFAYSKAW